MKCLAVAGFAAMNIMLLSVSVWSGSRDMTPETRDFFHWLSALIALPAAAYAGQPFFRSAWRALRAARAQHGRADLARRDHWRSACRVVETTNHAQHAYFDSAIMLLFFLLCGRALDHAMRRKTRAVAGNLAALKAEIRASASTGGEIVVRAGRRVAAGRPPAGAPGDRVPADGVVVSGSSEIDDSLVTGETARRAVAAGAAIHAGSGEFLRHADHAGHGGRKRHADRRGRAAAGEGRQRRNRAIVRLADRAARLYAPVVHATAALTLSAGSLAGARCTT